MSIHLGFLIPPTVRGCRWVAGVLGVCCGSSGNPLDIPRFWLVAGWVLGCWGAWGVFAVGFLRGGTHCLVRVRLSLGWCVV